MSSKRRKIKGGAVTQSFLNQMDTVAHQLRNETPARLFVLYSHALMGVNRAEEALRRSNSALNNRRLGDARTLARLVLAELDRRLIR